MVNLFFGSFRKADADDPETFTAGCLRLFTAYPPAAVQHIVDPVTGLPGRSEWLPTMKVIKDALDGWQSEQRRATELKNQQAQIERTIAERHEWLAKRAAAPAAEELKKKHGENWGMAAPTEVSEAMQRTAKLAKVAEAGRRMFLAECRNAGIDPGGGVSPSLIALLREKAER